MIARLGGLLLILGTMIAVQRVGPARAGSTVMLPLGFALVSAYLLGAVADLGHLGVAYGEALEHGYLWHEFGDSHLIVASVRGNW